MVAEDRIPFFTYSRMLTDSPEVTGFLKLLVTLDRMELTALDVHYLVQELQQLTDAKVEKVYQSQTDRKDILLQMYLREWPKLFLRVQAPGLVCLEEEKPAYPQVPPAFAMFLRKYLVGARLQKAEQIGFDRIVKLAFTGKHESELILELLPPGNIIMLADGKVKNLAEQQRHKDRTIRGGVQYEPPPPQIDLRTVSDEKLAQMIVESTRKSIVTTLAMVFGLGGVYAEEACSRAGVEKSRADLSKEEVARAVGAVRELFSQEIKPYADEKRTYPFQLQSQDVSPAGDLFLRALARFVTPPSDGEKQEHKEGSKKDKVQNMVRAQTKRLGELELEGVEEQRKGELIYEQYQIVEKILRAAKEDPDSLHDIKEVKKHENAFIEVEL